MLSFRAPGTKKLAPFAQMHVLPAQTSARFVGGSLSVPERSAQEAEPLPPIDFSNAPVLPVPRAEEEDRAVAPPAGGIRFTVVMCAVFADGSAGPRPALLRGRQRHPSRSPSTGWTATPRA